MLKKLVPFSPIPASGDATLDVLTNIGGKIINRIILTLTGGAFTKAMLSSIKFRASDSEKGGKLIFESTGARNDARMQHRGIAAAAGFLSLDFTEIRSKTIKGQKLGSIDTRNLRTLALEVSILGATTPALVAHADFDEPADYDAMYTAPERSLIAKVLSQNYDFAAAGTFPVKLPYGQVGGSLIKRLFFHGATVTAAEVRKNGQVQFEAADGLNDFHQTEYGRVPQAAMFCVDFIVDGNQSGALNAAAAGSMEYYVTVSGAGNVGVEMELLDPLGNN